MFLLVCVISLFFVWIPTNAENACKNEPSNYAILGSKTAYDEVRGDEQAHVAECEPVELYMLIRHGSRTADQEEIQEMNKALPLLQNRIATNAANGTLCPEALNAIKSWTQRMTSTDDLTLGELGKKELKELGQRYRGKLPTLLGSQNASYYNFRSTSAARTINSAKSFAEGLQIDGGLKDEDITVVPYEDDEILKFYYICDKYVQTVKNVKKEEVEKFKKSQAMTDMIKQVNTRLGLQHSNDLLSLDEIELMYETCRFDYALFRDAPWCKVFSETDLKTLEYREDLKYYWRNGYNMFPITQDMTCPLRRDMLEVFEKVVDGYTNKPAFRFAHTTTLMTLFSSMDLFKDETPLRANNMASQSQREWRSSVIDPFTTNIAITLFKCKEDYKLTAMVNEKLVKIPGCSKNACTWSEFYDVVSRSQLECYFKETCSMNAGSRVIFPVNTIILSFLFFIGWHRYF